MYTPDEVRTRIRNFRFLADRFYNNPSGPNSHKHRHEILDLLEKSSADDQNPEHMAAWEDLGRRIVEEINPSAYCGEGPRRIREARILLGLPVIEERVVIGVRIEQMELPTGKETFNPNDYIITVTHRDGTPIAVHKSADVVSTKRTRMLGKDDFGDHRY